MCCASDADDWWLCTEDLAAPLQLLLWQPVYTGINLLKELKKRGYRATGTKRENRITKECPVAAKKTCWSSLKDLFNLQITQMMALSLHDGLITRSSPWPQPSMAWFQLQACSDIHRQKRKLSVYQDRAYLLHTIKEWEARVWPICSRLRMTASLRLRESFCLVTPTVGLIAWSLWEKGTRKMTMETSENGAITLPRLKVSGHVRRTIMPSIACRILQHSSVVMTSIFGRRTLPYLCPIVVDSWQLCG